MDIYYINDSSFTLASFIENAIAENAIILCEDPDFILKYAKEKELGDITVMDFNYLKNVTYLNKPVMIYDINRFLKLLCPALDISALTIN